MEKRLSNFAFIFSAHILIVLSCIGAIYSSFMPLYKLQAEEKTEDIQAFYALSSLHYYFTNILDSLTPPNQSDQISFTQEEISSLWNIVLKSKFARSEVLGRFLKEDTSPFYTEKSRKIVTKLWKVAQKSILGIGMQKTPRKVVEGASFDNKNKVINKTAPYILPSDHRIAIKVGELFSDPHVTMNRGHFVKNGFNITCNRSVSLINVVRHPDLPGYIFKVYLQTENREKNGVSSWKWLVRRCKGARIIRKIIDAHHLQYFTVPEKWLYILPYACKEGHSSMVLKHPVILIADDMNILSHKESADAWRHKITKKHLDELYCILSHGLPSCYLVDNIPYTKDGVFACIDTEHPKRDLNYSGVKRFIAPELKKYWDDLVKKGGNLNR